MDRFHIRGLLLAVAVVVFGRAWAARAVWAVRKCGWVARVGWAVREHGREAGLEWPPAGPWACR